MRVREAAAEEVEGRQSEWAYSKPVVALDLAWNLVFLAIGATVLGVSTKEEPCVPLRVWIVGYLLQGLLHSLCVVFEFRRRRRELEASSSFSSSSGLDHDRKWESAAIQWSYSSESDGSSEQFLQTEENRYTSFNFNILVVYLLFLCGWLISLHFSSFV